MRAQEQEQEQEHQRLSIKSPTSKSSSDGRREECSAVMVISREVECNKVVNEAPSPHRDGPARPWLSDPWHTCDSSFTIQDQQACGKLTFVMVHSMRAA